MYQYCLEFVVSGNPKPILEIDRIMDDGSIDRVILSEPTLPPFIANPFDLHYQVENPDQPQIYGGCLLLETPSHYDNRKYILKVKNKYGSENRTTNAHFISSPGRLSCSFYATHFVNQYFTRLISSWSRQYLYIIYRLKL